jgi:hypothetical protein
VTDDEARIQTLRSHGWRQGSVLPSSIVEKAKLSNRWPPAIAVGPDDWLIVVSHTCDVRNRNPNNEPDVELLVARPLVQGATKANEAHGRNSRRLQFKGKLDGRELELLAYAHERFATDRLLLAQAPPDEKRRVDRLDILITWIAKRYRRQAFPDDFDQLARKAKDKVDKFLMKNAAQIAVVFISFAERPDRTPQFHVGFRLVVKRSEITENWADQKESLEADFESCWVGVPNVEVEAAAVQDRNFSIGEMLEGRFEKFDRDWISYATDSEGEAAPEA